MNDVVETPQNRDNRKWAIYAALALAIVIVMIYAAHSKPSSGDITTGDFMLKYELLFRYEKSLASSGRSWLAPAYSQYSKSAKTVPSPAVIRRIGVVTAELGRPAMPVFDRLTSKKTVGIEEPSGRSSLPQELAMWHDIYGRVEVSPKDVSRYDKLIRSLDLGPARWFALHQLYISARQPEQAEKVLLYGERRAFSSFMAAAALVAIWIMMGLAGLILLFVFGSRADALKKEAERIPEGMPSTGALWSSFIAFMILFVVLQLIAGQIVANGDFKTKLLGTFVSYVSAGILGMCWLVVRVKSEGSDLAAIGLTTRDFAQKALAGVAGYATLLPAVAVALFISQVLAKLMPELPTPTHPIGPLIGENSSNPIVYLILVLVAVMAPIFEETFFRGVLFNALRLRYSALGSILLSGAIFAIIHPQLPLGFLPLFVLGAGFAVLLATTKSLVPSMFAHAINNTIAFFLALYMLSS